MKTVERLKDKIRRWRQFTRSTLDDKKEKEDESTLETQMTLKMKTLKG